MSESELEEAKDPSTDPARLADLVASEDTNVRKAVAGNPATPIEVLLKLASDAERIVRTSVAIERIALWAIENGVPLHVGGELHDLHRDETILISMADAPDGTRDLVAAQRIRDWIVLGPVWQKIWAAAGIEWEISDDSDGYSDRGREGLLWIAPEAPDWWNEDLQHELEGGHLPSYVWEDLNASFDASTAAQLLQEVADRWLTSNSAGQLPEHWETWDNAKRLEWDDVRNVIEGALARNPSTPDTVLREVASGNFDDTARSQLENEGLRWLVTRNPGASDETRALAALSLREVQFNVPVHNWKASVSSVFVHLLDRQLDEAELRLLSEEGWRCEDHLQDSLFDIDYTDVDDAPMDMNVFDYEVDED